MHHRGWLELPPDITTIWLKRNYNPGSYIPAIHKLGNFISAFGKLFRFHDGPLKTQATLGLEIQHSGESFIDFHIQFEDASLKADDNNKALRWSLLKQNFRDLHNRLTQILNNDPTGLGEVIMQGFQFFIKPPIITIN